VTRVRESQAVCSCCHGPHVRELGPVKGFVLARCGDCGLMFVNQRVSLAQLEAAYTESKFSKWERRQELDLPTLWERFDRVPSEAKSVFSTVLQDAARLRGSEHLDILEVGSAKAHFVDFARRLGHRCVGTEAAPALVDHVNAAGPGYLHYVENLRLLEHFGAGSFDFVFLQHVFEHLQEAPRLAGEFYEMLRPGGVLTLIVPNHDSLVGRWRGTRDGNVTPPLHLYFFTPEALRSLLTRTGFNVVSLRTMNTFAGTAWQSYSVDRFLNRAAGVLNRRLGTRLKRLEPGRNAPRTPLEFLRLSPFFFYDALTRLAPSGLRADEIFVTVQRPL
jgi:predicted SAM-dependent methyltransferase